MNRAISGRKWLVMAAVAASSLAWGACGDSSDGTHGAAKAEATATASNPEAAAIVEQASPPTEILATTKSAKPLPKGSDHKIAYIHCGQAGCEVGENAVRQAVEEMGLGWTVETVPTDGTPESIQNGWNSALRMSPDAIYACCFDESLVKKQLDEAKQRGIAVFDSYSLIESEPDKKFYAFAGESALTNFGRTMAGWVATDSGGDANVLFISLSAFPPLRVVAPAFHDTLEQVCSGCKVDDLEFALEDIGKTGPGKIVSYLRAHPDVDYIVYNYDGLGIGVPAALKAAGLDANVRSIGQSPDPTSIGYIRAGQQAATVSQGYYELWTGAVDATARVLTDQEVDPKELDLQTWLYTPDVPEDSTGSDGPVVPDLYDKYLTLWPGG